MSPKLVDSRRCRGGLALEEFMKVRNVAILGAVMLSCALGRELASGSPGAAADVTELKVSIREWAVPTKGESP
jgi:hypothetical protein